MAKLKAAFKDGGTVTAGNSSKISDGASALVVMSGEKARSLGVKPMARVVAQAAAGVELEDVLVAPIKSIPKALKKAGLSLADMDLFEINEAFSASTLAVIKALGIDRNKVNVRGGAVALGHPIGASGARVLTTMLYALRERGLKERDRIALPRRRRGSQPDCGNGIADNMKNVNLAGAQKGPMQDFRSR